MAAQSSMIENNTRADIFRQRVEDRNALSEKFSIYYGIGAYDTIDGNNIYKTRGDNIINVVNGAFNATLEQGNLNNSTVYGTRAMARGNGHVAIGADAFAGMGAVASCTAIGANAQAAGGTGQIAIGAGAQFVTSSGGLDSTMYSCRIGGRGYTGGSFYFYNKVVNTDNSSDIRLKEDIKNADTKMCLDDVNRLPVVRFKYKDFVVNNNNYNDRHVTGFLADDVEKVFPKAVRVEEGVTKYQKRDANGNLLYKKDESGNDVLDEIELNDVKHINMSDIGIATLWGAVQELSKQLEEANNRIKALEEKNSK